MTYHCRGCLAPLDHQLIDLGPAPLANALVKDLDEPETIYPLRAFVCTRCFLVQLPEIADPRKIFNEEYVYFSSQSTAFVRHAREFAEGAKWSFGLGAHSKVVEIASNDGYLLQHFNDLGVPTLGIEPSASVAKVAVDKGVDTMCAFFNSNLAREMEGVADLIVANNVLAHVPDLHDFVEGLRIALKPKGRISIEFPHALNMLRGVQFDTIYHEHYSYFSMIALIPIIEKHGLQVVNAWALPDIHGGSLRIHLAHKDDHAHVADYVHELVMKEVRYGLNDLATYEIFRARAFQCRTNALEQLFRIADIGQTIGAYGAAAKGNTFLNFCGIKRDLIPWVADSTPFKIGKFMPGSRIPIVAESHIRLEAPRNLVILPWNWFWDLSKKAADQYGFTGNVFAFIHGPVAA